MAGRHRIIFLCALLASACGGSKKDVEHAKHSLYDTDFALVYSAALEATRELYPNLNDNPGPGKISTAWHQVVYASDASQNDMVNPRTVAQSQGYDPNMGASPAATAAGMPTRLAYKRFYIRFDVSVIGGRPWRVKIVGHASEWDPGAAMPVEMHGANRPPWLEGRSDALTLAIYKKIKQYAVPMKETPVDRPEDAVPRTDPSSFKGLPAPAAKQLAAIKDVLAKRAYADLRPLLADDMTWSLGGGTGADAAMALWQADPATFDAMAATLAACVADGDRKVSCPGGQPAAGQYQLVLEARPDGWKVTSFVKAEN